MAKREREMDWLGLFSPLFLRLFTFFFCSCSSLVKGWDVEERKRGERESQEGETSERKQSIHLQTSQNKLDFERQLLFSPRNLLSSFVFALILLWYWSVEWSDLIVHCQANLRSKSHYPWVTSSHQGVMSNFTSSLPPTFVALLLSILIIFQHRGE